MIAAGFGCSSGCSVQDVLDALEQSLIRAELSLDQVEAFFTADFKGREGGLVQAARHLSKPLLTLSLEQLAAHSHAALTRSEVVLARWGVPSIAETAALAGAAGRARGAAVPFLRPAQLARLLAARQNVGHASCALAAPLSVVPESEELAQGLARLEDEAP